MDKSGASAYVYAKASGMLARSFVGPRSSRLFQARSLSELWSLLFVEEVPAVPETLLARQIEKKSCEKFISEYIKLVNTYSDPDKVYTELLHFFDYENLKNFAAVLAKGSSEIPEYIDISPFNILNYGGWPKIEKITADSELSWYNEVPEFSAQQEMDSRLDIQFIRTIWKACEALKGSEREAVRNLIVKRYSMRNMIWVLRLKTYYKMEKDEILSRLAFIDESKGKDDILASDAVEVLSRNVDSYEDWASWKYAEYLNPHEDGVVWSLDPRWVETKAEQAFMRSVVRQFHVYPFTPMVLVSWFFIKAKELDYIRTATEALRLNVQEEQAMEMAGISRNSMSK